MSITKRVRKDGSSVYDVSEYVGFKPDGTRAREYATRPTLREARAAQADMLAKRDAARGRKATLRHYVEVVWWPSLKDLAPSSRTTYERELRLRIMPALGQRDLRSIDRTMIQARVDGCATETVARKAVSVLKAVLNEAKADGLLPSNPACARFAYPSPGRKRDEGTVVTRFSSMGPLFDAAEEYGAEVGEQTVLKLMVTGMLMGMRPEERYALDWDSFDAAYTRCDVTAAYTTASKAEGGAHMKAPKTELSTRTVPVPDAARAYLLRMERGSGAFIEGADGGRISPSTAQKRIKRFYRVAAERGLRLPYITIENMRHSFATSYLHAGGNIEDLSRILGHSDINTTYRRYVRPSVDDLAIGMSSVVRI